MSGPSLSDSERLAVQEVLDSRYLSIGPRLREFEEAFATRLGVAHAVGVSSGTAGLHLAVIAAGIKESDLVITTPFSFIASANCILFERGIPIFVDVDRETGNIDPDLVHRAAEDLLAGGDAGRRWLPPAMRDVEQSSLGKLKAILPVHAFGQPADMDPILETAGQSGLFVVEDACEAIGARYNGELAGSLGDVAAFAFYPNKQMTTGEGGMVVTNCEAHDRLFRSLRNQGRDVFDAWLTHTRLGYNYRLDEMSAALGLAQLRRIDDLLTQREQVAHWYHERLAGLELIERPVVAATTTRMSWFVYVVRVLKPADRNQVMARLEKVDIPGRPYFTPIHLQPFYQETFGYQRGDFPVTERLGDESLALPFSSVMTEDQVDLVCAEMRKIVEVL